MHAEEKGPTMEMVDTMGAQLAAMTQKLEGLTKEVDDVLAKKSKWSCHWNSDDLKLPKLIYVLCGDMLYGHQLIYVWWYAVWTP